MSHTLQRLSRVLTPLAPALTLLLLGGLVLRQWNQVPGAEPAGEREPVPQLTKHLPAAVGPWIGQPWTPPEPARPARRSIQRQSQMYENVETGRRVALLIVQGGDRRDLLGYMPSKWYVARGWHILSQREMELSVAGVNVPTMACELTALGRTAPMGVWFGEVDTQLLVISFAMLADGRLTSRLDTARAMPTAFEQAGAGPGLVQVVFPGDTPRQERHAALQSLVRAVILSIEESAGD